MRGRSRSSRASSRADALSNGVARIRSVATLVLLGLGLDRLYVAFFNEHLSRAVAREALDAIRTRAVPVNYSALGAIALAALFVFVALGTFLKVLALLPRSARLTDTARRAAIPSLLVVGTLASIRACVIDPPAPAATSSPSDEHARLAALFGAKRIFDDVQTARATLASHPPHARTRAPTFSSCTSSRSAPTCSATTSRLT